MCATSQTIAEHYVANLRYMQSAQIIPKHFAYYVVLKLRSVAQIYIE